MELRYFKKDSADQFSFIRIPKAIVLEPEYDSLSMQARILYGLLLDKMGCAYKNKWIDELNRVYIIYPLSEIQEDMSVSKHKAISCLSELEGIGLIQKKIRGQGKPNLIYVMNFASGKAI